jgi:hypothetical protein
MSKCSREMDVVDSPMYLGSMAEYNPNITASCVLHYSVIHSLL